MSPAQREDAAADATNVVRLSGRVSGDPQTRELPSGDELVTLRLVVDRPAARRPGGPRVDTLDLVCWSARVRRQALRLSDRDLVTIEGAVRRRFWRGGAGVQSRVEIEVDHLKVVSRVRDRVGAPG